MTKPDPDYTDPGTDAIPDEEGEGEPTERAENEDEEEAK